MVPIMAERSGRNTIAKHGEAVILGKRFPRAIVDIDRAIRSGVVQ